MEDSKFPVPVFKQLSSYSVPNSGGCFSESNPFVLVEDQFRNSSMFVTMAMSCSGEPAVFDMIVDLNGQEWGKRFVLRCCCAEIFIRERF